MKEQVVICDKNVVEPDRLLNFVCELGIRLIRNGADMYRVEESIERVIHAYGYDLAEVFAIPSLIIINIQSENKNYTKSIRVRASANNLDRLNKLNSLSRKICSEYVDIDIAENELHNIAAEPGYSLLLSFIAYGFVAFFFTLFWGGSFLDAAVAFSSGITVKFIIYHMRNLKANVFFTNLIAGSFLAVIPTILSYILTCIHLDKIIIGAIMLLVPGVAIINVMRDILSGDLLTAVTKFAEVMIVAVAIAIGIAIPIAGIRMIVAGLVF